MTILIENIEKVFMTTGLGIFLISIWSFYFLGALRFKSIREFSFFRPQIILGLLVLTVAVWGLLSLINPPNGFPGWTTQSISTDLGGSIGSSILGSSVPVQILRISSLFLLTLIIINPKLVNLIFQSFKMIFQLISLLSKKIVSNYQHQNISPTTNPISSKSEQIIEVHKPEIKYDSESNSSWGSTAKNLGVSSVGKWSTAVSLPSSPILKRASELCPRFEPYKNFPSGVMSISAVVFPSTGLPPGKVDIT